MNLNRLPILAACLALSAGAALAQGASITLGSGGFDKTTPVEVSADALSVDQRNGQAVFDGNVLVVQGDVRMTAGKVTVEYAKSDTGATSGIARLLAEGGVTFVTATDAAEAQNAVYSVADSQVVLQGDVLLTQGPNAISGEKLVVDLTSGTGRMEGRVRTVITPGGDN